MISFQNVAFKYPGGDEWVLKDVNVTIQENEFVGIIGGNGAGKSTFCKAMNGLIPHYYVGDFEGVVRIGELETTTSNVAALSRKVAYVYQDFEHQLVRPTVYDEAIFSPLNFGYQDYKERGMNALRILDIEHLAKEYIWQLSGGQKHLVALAGALSMDPDILIIDEPVAQLDPAHAIVLYEKLKMLHEVYRKTILVIEHHTEFIADYCQQVLLLENGSVKWKKPVVDALNQVEELERIQLYPPQVTSAASAFQTSPKQLLPIRMQEATTHFHTHRFEPQRPLFTAVQPEGEGFVTFSNVSYGYKSITRKRKVVLDEVSLKINEGENIALVGSNGAGKSTLLKLMAGLIRPQSGTVHIGELLTAKTSPERLAEQVAYIYQHPEEMFIEDCIAKDIAYYLNARKTPNRDIFLEQIMERFRLQELANRDGRLLSGGQQRRASLAIGMATQPSLVLLDEPTASLDLATRKQMISMLKDVKQEVKATIVATHDMQLVAEWASRVIVLHKGSILADVSPGELFTRKHLLDEASLVPPQIVALCHELHISPAALSVDEFVAMVQKEVIDVEQLTTAF
ncbi:ABC transporter ATP-binding protein [Aureibacillus halotolerans]|uniref:Energy-coupling factor transport system ATP-binding protein n=1 Tax=Aureibacillus halotolerans TaxID=1508390 RepID=A0A4R6U5T4_9BACI|nr:ATP-binding cassette domain-containing protein [Aureibacillus halotolerans]TDQ41116.1 energy-coupling factor transport system ATP-binding protein [Aureibacillus halotolerans]